MPVWRHSGSVLMSIMVIFLEKNAASGKIPPASVPVAPAHATRVQNSHDSINFTEIAELFRELSEVDRVVVGPNGLGHICLEDNFY